MSFVWQSTPEDAFGGLMDDYMLRVRQAVHLLLMQYAPKIESWMKRNASWTDRTGNARQTLWARVEAALFVLTVEFDHGMDYGRFLEFSNQGRFAIVGPALDHFYPQITADLERMLRQ